MKNSIKKNLNNIKSTSRDDDKNSTFRTKKFDDKKLKKNDDLIKLFMINIVATFRTLKIIVYFNEKLNDD